MDINPYKEGTGAAGGLSFTLSQILGCKIVSGADYFMETTGLKEAINSFEVVILCEGRFDKSSLEGKIIGELLSENNQLNYFLGGQYDLDNNEAFEGIFECGVKGLSNPEKELMIDKSDHINIALSPPIDTQHRHLKKNGFSFSTRWYNGDPLYSTSPPWRDVDETNVEILEDGGLIRLKTKWKEGGGVR